MCHRWAVLRPGVPRTARPVRAPQHDGAGSPWHGRCCPGASMASRGREKASTDTAGAPQPDEGGGVAIGLRALGALLLLLAAVVWAGFAQLALATVAPVAGAVLL